MALAVGQRLFDFRPTAERFHHDDVKTAIDVRKNRPTSALHDRRRFFSGNFEFQRFSFSFLQCFLPSTHHSTAAIRGASDTCPPPPRFASNHLSVSRYFQEFQYLTVAKLKIAVPLRYCVLRLTRTSIKTHTCICSLILFYTHQERS